MESVLRRTAGRTDALLAAALTALGVFIVAGGGGGSRAGAALIPFMTVPVAWRRRAPFAATAAVAAGIVVTALPTLHQYRCGFAVPTALLVLWAVAVRDRLQRAALGLVLVLAAMVVLSLTDPVIDLSALVLFAPLSAIVWGAGRMAGAHARLAARLADRTRALQQQRSEVARLAVALERERVSADLDVSMHAQLRDIVARAERALRDPATPVHEVFGELEVTGRRSLDEMRGMLGVLRTADTRRVPRPTIADIERLPAVELTVEGRPAPLPGSVELSAYRVVQQALPLLDGAVAVRLRYLLDELEVEVDGRRRHAADAAERLTVARERVALHGGSLSVSASEPPRTVLRARLPLRIATA